MVISPIRWIDDPAAQWAGKRVLCRLDLDVAVAPKGRVVDAAGVLRVVPTLRFLLRQGARVIVVGHRGDPKAKVRGHLSLLPVAECLQERLRHEIVFVHDCVGGGVRCLVNDLRDGRLLMLENTRFYRGEYTQHSEFVSALAALADVYVNDALGCSHLAHASLSAVPRSMSRRLGGLGLRQDLQTLRRLRDDPPRPVVAILGDGGENPVDLLRAAAGILPIVDTLCVGGRLAWNGKAASSPRLWRRAKAAGVTVELPRDCLVATGNPCKTKDGSAPRVVSWGEMTDDAPLLDIGPMTRERFGEVIAQAGTVLLLGGVGAWRQPQCADGTRSVVNSLTQGSRSCIVLGAEAAAACRALGRNHASLHFVGGSLAPLLWLGREELPGLRVLTEQI
ncbi:MAG: phosphoglycerate kinase [Myxococcota bacterium]